MPKKHFPFRSIFFVNNILDEYSELNLVKKRFVTPMFLKTIQDPVVCKGI